MSFTNNRFSLLDSVGEFFDLEQRPSKKPRTESRHQRCLDTTTMDQQKYLVMSHQEEGKMLTRLTPFGVQKGLEGITTGIEDVQKLRSGDLLILAKSRTAAESLKKATNLGGLAKIKVVEHPFLNNSKGLVFSYDLLDLTETEITEGLQRQNVIETRRIKKWSEGKLVDTPALVLTFANAKIPETIKAGYIHLKVKLFIPNPLRCTVCQRFGHPKKRCNGTPTCPKCSKSIPLGHEGIACDAAKCVNCQQDHFAYSRDCAVYQKEAEIVKIKTVDRISHKQAKEKYYRQHANTTGANPTSTKSFADIVKSHTSASTSKKSLKGNVSTPSEPMDTQQTSLPNPSPGSTLAPSNETYNVTPNIDKHSTELFTINPNVNILNSPFAIPPNHKPQQDIEHTHETPIQKRTISTRSQKLKRTTSKEQLFDQHRTREVANDDHHAAHHINTTIHPRAKLSEAEEAILNSNERQG